jgi:hypothetical protein
MGEDEAHWRRALEQSRSAPFAPDGLRKAADQALESGFLQYAFDIRPHVMPEFLAQYVHSPDSATLLARPTQPSVPAPDT